MSLARLKKPVKRESVIFKGVTRLGFRAALNPYRVIYKEHRP